MPAAACICHRLRRISLAAAASSRRSIHRTRIAPAQISIPDAGPSGGIRDCLSSILPVLIWRSPAGQPHGAKAAWVFARGGARPGTPAASSILRVSVPAVGRHVCGSTEDPSGHLGGAIPVSSIGKIRSANAAVTRDRVAILAALVIKDPCAIGDWTGGHSHNRCRQRRRIQPGRPWRADADDPIMSNQDDDEGDDQDRPRASERTALAPAAEQRHEDQE